MTQPNYTPWERIKLFIAGIAWNVFLWASEQTNDEFITMVLENAAAEYRSEKANNWRSL